jgi:hypothetical protein
MRRFGDITHFHSVLLPDEALYIAAAISPRACETGT